MRVLLLLDHAPNYRESFLRELGLNCELTVLAHPCERDKLVQPNERIGYAYIELQNTYGSKIRLNFQFKEIVKSIEPDVICVALNPHHPMRILFFLTHPKLWKKWIWWGQIYGHSSNSVLNNFRKKLLQKGFGTLVYSDDIAQRIRREDPKINVQSFNNSQFSKNNFRKFPNNQEEKIKCLFVGRPQERKKLTLLVDLVRRRNDVIVRLVGPGMNEYFEEFKGLSNLELFSGASGQELEDHFKWSNIVLNPGHVGLLVMNAGAHHRAIVINSKVNHAPEVILAREANQFFVDFDNETEVDQLLNSFLKDPELYRKKGEELFDFAINKYTVERMAQNHMSMFRDIAK